MDGIVRVLYVRRESELGCTMPERLEQANDRLQITTVTGVEPALQALGERIYDCLVSEYKLPDGNALELFDQVRNNYSGLPFILFTDHGDKSVITDAITAGVTDCVQKALGPAQHKILANRINNAVSAHRTAMETDRERHRFEQVVKTTPSCVVQLDRSGQFIFANDRAETVLGLEQTELKDRTYSDPEWDIKDLDGNPIPDSELPFARVLHTGESVRDIQHTIRWPDGRERVLSVSGAPVIDEKSVESVVFSLTDVTDQHRHEQGLKRLHRATRELYDAGSKQEVAEIASDTADVILDFDLNGIHLYNEQAGGLKPAAVSERTQRVVDELVTFDHGIAWEAFQSGEVRQYGDIRNADEIYDPETDFRSGLYLPLGEYGILLANSIKSNDFDEVDVSLGQLLAENTKSALDRVERGALLRERTQKLTKQNQQLDEFARTITHDLRNPMQVLRGTLDGVRQTTDIDHLDRGYRALDRMETLIDDVLALAQQGQLIDETETVSLAALAHECWDVLETDEAELVVEEDIQFEADPGRVRQIFENLFANSVTHAGDDVTVTVDTLPDGFSVGDDGPGIDPIERDQIFTDGYTSTGEGTGFGLAIVKQIADAHGWTADVTQSPSGGTQIELRGVGIASSFQPDS